MWLASWGFWLCFLAIAVLSAARAVERHRDDHFEGERDWQLRVDICKRLSSAPRPRWPECHVRAKSHDANLLSPRGAEPMLLPPAA
jgi:hypothetical protein